MKNKLIVKAFARLLTLEEMLAKAQSERSVACRGANAVTLLLNAEQEKVHNLELTILQLKGELLPSAPAWAIHDAPPAEVAFVTPVFEDESVEDSNV